MAITVQDINTSATMFCLSTDTKPTSDKVPNASLMIEMDTMKAFFWDAENKRWIPVR